MTQPRTHAFAEYVHTNTEYYVPRAEKLDQGGKAGFNLAAFLAGAYWCIYRKMYGLGAILIILDEALDLLLEGPSIVFLIAIRIALGFFGTKLYVKRVREYQEGELELSPLERESYFNSCKGTSRLAVILALIIVMILNATIQAYLNAPEVHYF